MTTFFHLTQSCGSHPEVLSLLATGSCLACAPTYPPSLVVTQCELVEPHHLLKLVQLSPQFKPSVAGTQIHFRFTSVRTLSSYMRFFLGVPPTNLPFDLPTNLFFYRLFLSY